MKDQNPWTRAELETLIRLYPDHNNDAIACLIGRSESAVAHKGHRLRLKKSDRFNNSSRSGRVRKRRPSLLARLLSLFSTRKAADL